MKNHVLSSSDSPTKKIIFKDPEGRPFYTVSFYDPDDNSINLCLSSQVGCLEKCLFCATGDAPFVRNLSNMEIEEQFKSGIESMIEFNTKNPRILYAIFEGMGEPTYNIVNCLGAFKSFHNARGKNFDRIALRISTAGNPDFIQEYKRFVKDNTQSMNNVKFQFQMSLHSPFDKERERLVPHLGKKYSLEYVTTKLKDLADFLNCPLKFNYMLLNLPWGGTNYTDEHLRELTSVSQKINARIKLTRYSETSKGFSSPDDDTYERVKLFLESHNIRTTIRPLFGSDINAACGMLDYRE